MSKYEVSEMKLLLEEWLKNRKKPEKARQLLLRDWLNTRTQFKEKNAEGLRLRVIEGGKS